MYICVGRDASVLFLKTSSRHSRNEMRCRNLTAENLASCGRPYLQLESDSSTDATPSESTLAEQVRNRTRYFFRQKQHAANASQVQQRGSTDEATDEDAVAGDSSEPESQISTQLVESEVNGNVCVDPDVPESQISTQLFESRDESVADTDSSNDSPKYGLVYQCDTTRRRRSTTLGKSSQVSGSQSPLFDFSQMREVLDNARRVALEKVRRWLDQITRDDVEKNF